MIIYVLRTPNSEQMVYGMMTEYARSVRIPGTKSEIGEVLDEALKLLLSSADSQITIQGYGFYFVMNRFGEIVEGRMSSK